MKKYQKPLFQRVRRFDFTPKTLDEAGNEIACRQCASCHGCR